MYYYLIIGLQGYCIYHALKNKNENYWLFIIFFIPLLGSIIYLFTQVFNKQDLEQVQQNIIATINPTKKILDLKTKLEFSETFQNKVNLADAYLEIEDYQNAIHYYENATVSVFSGDTYVISNLIKAYYSIEDYENTVKNYNLLQEKSIIISPENQLQYGLALDKLGKTELAKKEFKKINSSFSNYNERYILAKHLVNKDKNEDAKVILQELLNEAKHFSRDHAKIYRQTINAATSLLKRI